MAAWHQLAWAGWHGRLITGKLPSGWLGIQATLLDLLLRHIGRALFTPQSMEPSLPYLVIPYSDRQREIERLSERPYDPWYLFFLISQCYLQIRSLPVLPIDHFCIRLSTMISGMISGHLYIRYFRCYMPYYFTYIQLCSHRNTEILVRYRIEN